MSSLTIRNLPDEVHEGLRRIAAERRMPVEAFLRAELAQIVKRQTAPPRGIDFERIARKRRELGFTEPWPEWTPDLDDPTLSRRVLGLDDEAGQES